MGGVFSFPLRPHSPSETKMKRWTTKDGQVIRVCDLMDSHLVNIIKMLERNHNFTLRDIEFPSFGGEMAQCEAEHIYFQMMKHEPVHLYPIYDALIEEAEDRQLNYE